MTLAGGDVPTPDKNFLSPIVVAKLIISSHLATMAIGSANPASLLDRKVLYFPFFSDHLSVLCLFISIHNHLTIFITNSCFIAVYLLARLRTWAFAAREDFLKYFWAELSCTQCSAKVAKTWGQMSQQPWKLGDIFKISETLAFFLKIHLNALRTWYLGATVCPQRNKWSWSLQRDTPPTAHRCWNFSAKLVLVYKGAKCCITLIYIAIVRDIMRFFYTC